MDILIKNMELPKEGSLVLYVRQDGTVIIPYYFTVRLQTPVMKTTAVALPEHGDLADKIDIIHRIEKIADADADLAQDIIGEILASPTIVEANNE